MQPAPTDKSQAKALYAKWMDMWNGHLELAGEIFADGCVFHTASPADQNTAANRGPHGATQMVEQTRSIVQDSRCRCDLGPIVEGDMLAARWIWEGTYAGGMPGATAEPGTALTLRGTDMWRLDNNRVVECWISTEQVPFFAQLGLIST